MSRQLHARRPSIFALVIGGSLLTFVLNLYIVQELPAASVLALQWGPIPLDLGGNLAGAGFLQPYVLLILPLRAALSAWAICLLFDLPLRLRAVVRAGAVYVAAGALAALGLAASSAWEEALLSAKRVSRLNVWLYRPFLLLVAILLVGLFTSVLLKQFMEVSIRTVYKDPRHWALVVVSYLIWSAGNYIFFLWPFGLSYGLALALLSIQSVVLGAVFIGVAGWAELPEKSPAPAAKASSQ